MIDYLNDSKKTLQLGGVKKNAASVPTESETKPGDGSIVFKLFNDLNESDMSKLAKVDQTFKLTNRMDRQKKRNFLFH